MKSPLTYFGIIILPFLLIACVFFSSANEAFAQSGNIFGMHLAVFNEEDIEDIARLVNSNGGNWGYITLIIQEEDRDVSKWQYIFDTLKQKRLTPIIRIATKAEGPNWRRPEAHEAGEWATFLNSLTWPTAERHIILFNEPNHATEWGGSVDPQHYGTLAREFSRTLMSKDSRFRVMIAGIDSSAPSRGSSYEDQITFLDRMFQTFPVSDFNRYISGWASHSYPNPGFIGKPTDRGRGTITNFDWELSYLQSKGVKSLPVYITETGWKHREPGDNSYYPDANTVAGYFKSAFQDVWMKDGRVRAVTPFTFNFPTGEFRYFSWKVPNKDQFYPQYSAIQQIPKIPTLQSSDLDGAAYLWRFWSDEKQGHFYTASTQERDHIIRTYNSATWRYEGIANKVYTVQKEGTTPVYRFWSDQKQGHFYTASLEERNHVTATYDDTVWRYEGIGFYVYPLSKAGNSRTVYRFWSDQKQKHFYTASEAERDHVITTYDDTIWKYEGTAWKVVK